MQILSLGQILIVSMLYMLYFVDSVISWFDKFPFTSNKRVSLSER